LANNERRRALRVGLSIPVRVQGFEPDGTTWNEAASTADVSAGGTSFPLGRDVALGQVLLLILPLPQRLRQYDVNAGAYRVYALVRGIQRKPAGYRVGTMFFGKVPPKGFVDRPWARFLLPSDLPAGATVGVGPAPPPVSHQAAAPPASAKASAPSSRPPEPAPATSPAPASGQKERRQHPRFSLFVNLTLQQVDEWGAVLQEELTVANTVGKGGADVMTTLDLAAGDIVQVQEAGGGFATRAEIRAITRGSDGIGRLHLKFIDRLVPDRILDQA
jgi:PilZ domain